jgi:glutamate carboxypeptidase
MGAVHPVGRRASPLPFWVRGERVAGVGSDRNVTGALELPTLDRLGMIGEGPHTHENNLLIPCLIPRTTLWVRPFAKPMAADQAPGSSAAM